jgi:type IV pilus assembly protein PilO
MAKAQAQKPKKGPGFFSKVAALKKGAKIGILFGGLIALGAAFYTMYFSPWQEKVKALAGEVATLTSSISTEQSNINKHRPIAEYVVPVSNTYSYLKNYLTTENEIPRLIQIISDLGSQAGARVTLFAPKAAIPRDDYAEIQFTMNLEGPFLNVLKFFYSLSQMDRLINITSVTMDTPRMAENMAMVLRVRCEGSTYRVLTPEESTAAAQK